LSAHQTADELLFLPLGGAGEIGMNLNLYGHQGKWLMVDLGVTFGDASLPGIDLVMADPTYIAERRDDLVALVLTHGHEDHLGAVPYLWPRLRCPVYATPFAAALLRRKLAEAGLLDQVPLHEVAPGAALELGPFEVTYIGVTHSIPESHALAIRTSAGTVLHTGDWKLDPEPLLGPATDSAALEAVGSEDVLAMVCDSTNVFQPGESGSEASVRDSLMELVGHYQHRVAITTFASHIARLQTAAAVAAAHERHVVLVGRSIQRGVAAARECGYLTDFPPVLSEAEAGYLPPDKVLLLCTGSQGEPRGAIARIAFEEHPQVALDADDVVIFSSKIIPGNELAISRLYNQLVRRGIEVVTERRHFVHVSGHPNRDELARMYQWVRPRIAVPVHGELRHMAEHARLARSLQVPETVVAENGSVVRLAPGPARVVERVESGRLVLDGEALISPDAGALRERRRLMHNGMASVTVVLDEAGRLVAPPALAIAGVDGLDGQEEASAVVTEAVQGLSRGARIDDEACAEAARLALRRYLKAATGKKPPVEARVVRVKAS
jgi:ribonuclease J